jgi:hypothetical protein
MNLPSENERLLNDLLAEGTPADFRLALLDQTLGLARWRRRWRQTRRAAAALAVFAGLAVGLWRLAPPPPPAPVPAAARSSVEIVRTRPLPAGALVSTQPFPSERQATSALTVTVVTTLPGSNLLRELSDNELLALVAPRPAALVWRGPHAAELVFVNPADRAELLGN